MDMPLLDMYRELARLDEHFSGKQGDTRQKSVHVLSLDSETIPGAARELIRHKNEDLPEDSRGSQMGGGEGKRRVRNVMFVGTGGVSPQAKEVGFMFALV